MKKIRVAINGFGRIGRLVLRAALESGRKDIEFVAVNDLAPIEQNAYLLEYDSVHGKLNMDVKINKDYIIVGNQKIKCLCERDVTKLPWKQLKIDIVMECTGLFTAADKARVHLENGAKRVLVSAPSVGADKTIVFGVNENKITKKDLILCKEYKNNHRNFRWLCFYILFSRFVEDWPECIFTIINMIAFQ